MQFAEFLAGIIAESELLLDAYGTHGSAEVTTCPSWTVADVVRHTGDTHRWAISNLQSGVEGVVAASASPTSEIADSDLVAWFSDGVAELVALLAQVGPQLNCWTFGAPRSSLFWARRMCHETAIHRVDAQMATGTVHPIDAPQAADGIDEILTVMLRLAFRAQRPAPSPSLHLHRIDEGEGCAEWMVTISDDGAVEIEHVHGKGEVAVRGTASDLLLFLWGRLADGEGSLESFGDPAVVSQWSRLAP